MSSYKDEIMELLKSLMDYEKKHGSVGYDHIEWVRNPDNELRKKLRYLEDNGLIKVDWVAGGCPLAITLNAEAQIAYESYISPPQKQESAQTNISIGTNYGVAAHHAHDITINTTITWDSVRSLIEDQNLPKEESQRINVLIDKVENLMNDQRPLERGVFSEINDLCQKYSWLSSSVASVAFQYLFL